MEDFVADVLRRLASIDLTTSSERLMMSYVKAVLERATVYHQLWREHGVQHNGKMRIRLRELIEVLGTISDITEGVAVGVGGRIAAVVYSNQAVLSKAMCCIKRPKACKTVTDASVEHDRKLFRRDLYDLLDYVATEKVRNKARVAVEAILKTSVSMDELLKALQKIKRGNAAERDDDVVDDEGGAADGSTEGSAGAQGGAGAAAQGGAAPASGEAESGL